MDRRARLLAMAITCRNCGRRGSLVWESELRPSRTPVMANLAALSGDFHLAMPRSYRGDLEIVCSHCGAVQLGVAERVPS